jgi:hypothetical protein
VAQRGQGGGGGREGDDNVLPISDVNEHLAGSRQFLEDMGTLEGSC